MTEPSLRTRIVGAIASRHIAGESIEDALPVCRWANDMGFSAIVSPWAGSGHSPRSMVGQYMNALDRLSEAKINFSLSIKLDALGYDVSLFDSLVDHAVSCGVRLHIDSLGPETADTALGFLRRATTKTQDVGFTLPARWRRSLQDADIVGELGSPVRIVKGQWPDPTAPGLDVHRNFIEIADRLAKWSLHVGVATHDLSLARKVLPKLAAATHHCALEQFFSLPLNGIDLANRFGCQYKVYVAYGSPGIPYNVRFTLARPRIAAWLVSDLVWRHRKPWEDHGVHQSLLQPGRIH